MTSIHSVENQKISVEMATGDINNLKASVYKVETTMNSPQNKANTLDSWIMTDNNKNNNKKADNYTEHYEMPRRLDWNVFRKCYDIYHEIMSS